MPVYFVQQASTGLIKIGYTGNVEQRVSSLRNGHGDLVLLAVIENGTRLAERNLHEMFASCRVSGEWFRPHDDLLRFIERAKTEPAITSVEGLLEYLRTSVACVNVAGFSAFIETWLTIIANPLMDGIQAEQLENAGSWKAAEIILTLGGHADRKLAPGVYCMNRSGAIISQNTKWIGVSDEKVPTATSSPSTTASISS